MIATYLMHDLNCLNTALALSEVQIAACEWNVAAHMEVTSPTSCSERSFGNLKLTGRIAAVQSSGIPDLSGSGDHSYRHYKIGKAVVLRLESISPMETKVRVSSET